MPRVILFDPVLKEFVQSVWELLYFHLKRSEMWDQQAAAWNWERATNRVFHYSQHQLARERQEEDRAKADQAWALLTSITQWALAESSPVGLTASDLRWEDEAGACWLEQRGFVI